MVTQISKTLTLPFATYSYFSQLKL